MATHSSVLAWRIPGTGEPGGLPSMGSHRVGHDWSDFAAAAAAADSMLKSRDITLSTKVRLVKAMVFPVVMYGCESGLWRKLSTEELMLLNCGVGELWSWKDWCWSWNSNTLATSCEELTHWKKTLMLEGIGGRRRRGRQEEKGTTEDQMPGWHHRFDGHEFEWTPGVGDGQGGLACCDSWGHKDLDMTELLNWTELNWYFYKYLSYFLIIELLVHFSIKVVFALNLKPWSNLCFVFFFIIWEWICDLKNKVT